jgi:predicted nucleic acid-binding protein
MKVIVADTGAIISLVHIGQIDVIEKVFDDFYIAKAVWIELNNYDNPDFDNSILTGLKTRVKEISSKNYLLMVMDFGESESVILFEELHADFLLIDDNKARLVAESLNINCIGTIGLLLKAKQKGLITELKPIFEKLIKVGRYISRKLLNDILIKIGESRID